MNSHLIPGEDPQKSLVTLTPGPEDAAFFPTEKQTQKQKQTKNKISTPCPNIKEELFCQELLSYENVEIKEKRYFAVNYLAGSQENKKHWLKWLGHQALCEELLCFQQQWKQDSLQAEELKTQKYNSFKNTFILLWTPIVPTNILF